MEGEDGEQAEGVIPRAIKKIYDQTRELAEKGWSYKMEASFLEIYNEEIRDLLATEKGLKYEIKKVDAKSNDTFVSNLKVHFILEMCTSRLLTLWPWCVSIMGQLF